MERLAKYLARSGIASRRKAEDYIIEGKVRVNNIIVKELGYKISEEDKVFFNDVVVLPSDKVYLMLNKPIGYITTLSDELDRKTIKDLIPRELEKSRLYPIGRLDHDTCGLLILTNDGDLTKTLTHPSSNIEKEYEALIAGKVKIYELVKLEGKEFIFEGETIKFKKITHYSFDEIHNQSLIYITLSEGKNHEVKKIFLYFNLVVLNLKRIRMANITLDVGKGKTRHLTSHEVSILHKLANFANKPKPKSKTLIEPDKATTPDSQELDN
jgi:23S rRNA pseudouridine2605 synthase